MSVADRTSAFFSKLGESIKSAVKIILFSRRHSVSKTEDDTLIILGNGPSLAQNIANDMETIGLYPSLAVNFAANAEEEFAKLRPQYYLLVDPVFFDQSGTNINVVKLIDNLNNNVNWPMTLYLPVGKALPLDNGNIKIEHFNPIGVEGYDWLVKWAFSSGSGMPRPRNVLIPAIMIGILAGFKRILILGADHSWLKTLSVDDDNTVVSVQPHFYKDNEHEQRRTKSVYKDIKLHEVLQSMVIAFKSYHDIAKYAKSKNVEIVNCTPSSFIDAFPRRALKDCK